MASWSLLPSMSPPKSRIRHILWLFNRRRRLLQKGFASKSVANVFHPPPVVLIGAMNYPLGGTRRNHFDDDQKTFCIRIEDDQPAKCGYDFYSNTDRDYKGGFS